MINLVNPSFDLGPFTIYWYGIFMTLGFFSVVFFSFIEWKRKNYSKLHFNNLFWIGVIAGLWGARIWYLVFNPEDIESFLSFFQIAQGRSIQGSIFFITICSFFYIKKFAPEIEWRYVASIIIPNILIGQAIGRWGNFFDHNVYGLTFTEDSFIYSILPNFILNNMFINGEYRQPLFLYESIADLIGWIIINQFIKRTKFVKPGVHAGMYLTWYGITRASMENFRDPEYIMQIGDVHTSFILAILFALIGILIIIYYQFYYKKGQFYFSYQQFYYNQFLKSIIKSTLFFKFKYKNIFLSLKQNLEKVENNRKEFYDSIYEWYYPY